MKAPEIIGNGNAPIQDLPQKDKEQTEETEVPSDFDVFANIPDIDDSFISLITGSDPIPTTTPTTSESQVQTLDSTRDTDLTSKLNQLCEEVKLIKEMQTKILKNQEKLFEGRSLNVERIQHKTTVSIPVRQPLRPILCPNVSPNHSQSSPDSLSPNFQQAELEDTLPITSELMSKAMSLRHQACSVGNFAVLLVKNTFTTEELVNCNCNGSRGKFPLEKTKLNTVKKLVFMYCDVSLQQQDATWRISCIRCIDEFLRRDKRARIANRQFCF